MYDLKGKNVIVFGATRGVGKQVAIHYAKYGCNVGAFGRSLEQMEDIAKHLDKNDGSIKFYKGDVSNEEDVKKCISEFVSDFGNLDIAYNNAGFMGSFDKLEDLNYNFYEKIFSTNVLGTMFCARYEIEQMLKQKGGIIINCTSVAGVIGHKGNPIYSASKHAVCGLTRSLALRYAKDNIRINAIAPGSVETRMLLNLYDSEEKIENRKKTIPAGRFATVDEISNAVLFLSSNHSSFMNGHIMSVDGGVTAGRT